MYKSQSMERMKAMSSCGRLTEPRTRTRVKRPACGIAAAPMDASVAVALPRRGEELEPDNDELDEVEFHAVELCDEETGDRLVEGRAVLWICGLRNSGGPC